MASSPPTVGKAPRHSERKRKLRLELSSTYGNNVVTVCSTNHASTVLESLTTLSLCSPLSAMPTPTNVLPQSSLYTSNVRSMLLQRRRGSHARLPSVVAHHMLRWRPTEATGAGTMCSAGVVTGTIGSGVRAIGSCANNNNNNNNLCSCSSSSSTTPASCSSSHQRTGEWLASSSSTGGASGGGGVRRGNARELHIALVLAEQDMNAGSSASGRRSNSQSPPTHYYHNSNNNNRSSGSFSHSPPSPASADDNGASDMIIGVTVNPPPLTSSTSFTLSSSTPSSSSSSGGDMLRSSVMTDSVRRGTTWDGSTFASHLSSSDHHHGSLTFAESVPVIRQCSAMRGGARKQHHNLPRPPPAMSSGFSASPGSSPSPPVFEFHHIPETIESAMYSLPAPRHLRAQRLDIDDLW